MHIVLATGIYPPDIGGPATYASNIATEFAALGHHVTIITYASVHGLPTHMHPNADVIVVERTGGMIARWRRYARALKKYADDGDIVYAFSSVSTGIPIIMARLRKPKKVLRLGGDFFWERYTDRGGMKSLSAWYGSMAPSRVIGSIVTQWILSAMDAVIFSTRFQADLYRRHYRVIPKSVVIENALPSGSPRMHSVHTPFRLLVFSRLVSFKNISLVLRALLQIDHAILTIVGDGPLSLRLIDQAAALNLNDRVTFRTAARGEEKHRLLDEHDLLIVPSITEISPNAALEARAAGLPVLLTSETGLSAALTRGMIIEKLSSAREVVHAVEAIRSDYSIIASAAAAPLSSRSWRMLADEHLRFFSAFP